MGFPVVKRRNESGPDAPMVAAEIKRFDEIVAEIQDVVVDSWRRCAKLLKELRDGRYYRRTHTHVEDFCFDEWSISERRKRQIIASAKNAAFCESKMVNPRIVFTSEVSSRPLMNVPHGKMDEVAEMIEQRFEDKGVLTELAVGKIVKVVCPRKKKKKPERIICKHCASCKHCGGKGWTTAEISSTK